MSRILSSIVALVLLLSNAQYSFAQAAGAPSDAEITNVPLAPSVNSSDPTGPLNCFDYYTFGSVQADLQPTVEQTVPGATLNFQGDVVSENPYPLLDGTLYVKIFRRSDDTFAAGDGNEVVDQFVVKDGITLAPHGSVPVQYEWKVPTSAEGGEYYAAYFFATAERYNLMGLSFTDDVVGNQAAFTITSDTAVAKLSKVDTTLNGRDHHFAAFPLHFAAGEIVTIETTITNPTDTAKTLPLQWNQYAWDSMNKDNLRFTKTELITLAPNETKTLTYEVQNQREPVVYVTAVTQDNQAKSVLNIRYVYDGIVETRINFPGLTSFPLAADTSETLFACAHSTNEPMVPDNILTLTLADKTGNTIHEYRYEGDISGAMSGFGDTFTPAKNINYALLTATLERDGVIVEQVKQVYDCTQIDPSSCLPETETTNSFIDNIMSNPLISFTAIALLLTLLLVLFVHRRHNMGPHITSGPTMTTPMSVLFLVLLLSAFFLFTPSHQVEAKSVSWSWSDGGGEYFHRAVLGGNTYVLGMSAPAGSINYYATLYDNDSGLVIPDNAILAVGTLFKVVPKSHERKDISWFGTGYSSDSPNGFFILNAAPPDDMPQAIMPSCDDSSYVGSSRSAWAGEGDDDIHVPLSVNPPDNNIVLGGSAGITDLGNGIYRVDSEGSINVSVVYSSTYGKYYYRKAKHGTECYRDSNDTPMAKCPGGVSGTSGNLCYEYNVGEVYQLSIPARTITFTLSAVSANSAPTTPTITGPDTCTVGVTNSYSFTATDPDGDQVQYQIDWNGDGVYDSATSYLNSGSSASDTYIWNTAGTYLLKVRTKDINGAYSSVASKSVTCTNPPSATVDLVAPPTANKNQNITLSWTTQNVGSCTLYGNGLGSGYVIPAASLSSGSVNTTITATDTYILSCGSAPEENDQATVTVVNAPPTAPVIEGPSTGTEGQNYNYTFTSTDADGDQVYYVGSWGGTLLNPMPIPSTIYYDSGVSAPANNTWDSPGTYTIRVRASDGITFSPWATYTVVISDLPPAPDITLESSVDNGTWSENPSVTVNPDDAVEIRWSTANQVDSCTTTNLGGSIDSNSPVEGVSVTTPAPGTSESYTVSCAGPGGSDEKTITVNTRALPNLTGVSLSDPITDDAVLNESGTYDGVRFNIGFTNNGSQAISAGAGQYRLEYNTGTAASHTAVTERVASLPAIAINETQNFSVTLNGIPLGAYYITLEADIELATGGSIEETNENDNFADIDSNLAPADPGIELEVSPGLVRSGSSATVEWTITTPYDGMSCALAGPGVTDGYTVPASSQDSYDVASVTAKSEYTLSCTIDGYTFSDSATVEVVGEVEEV